MEFVLLPAATLAGKHEFRVDRDGKDPLVYTDVAKMRDDYQNDIVCAAGPSDVLLLTFLANTSTPQACCCRGSCSACNPDSRIVSELNRMAANRTTSVPASCEEREKGQKARHTTSWKKAECRRNASEIAPK